MATVALTPTQIVIGTEQAVTQGAGTAIVQANTNTIAYPDQGKLILWVDSDHASTAAVIAAGDGIARDQGALTWAIGSAAAEVIVINSDRHKKDEGYISITWVTNSAGFIKAFYLP